METEPDENGYKTEVFITKRATTTYDKATVFKVVPIEDILGEHPSQSEPLVKVNATAVRKYLEQHPELKDKIKEIPNNSNPYIASKKR